MWLFASIFSYKQSDYSESDEHISFCTEKLGRFLTVLWTCLSTPVRVLYFDNGNIEDVNVSESVDLNVKL